MTDEEGTPLVFVQVLSGRVLGARLDALLARFQKTEDLEERNQLSQVTVDLLRLLIQHAAPTLAHYRAVVAAQECEGGGDIDAWTGRDIEKDPEMMRAARVVSAQVLQQLPGLLPPVADEILPSNLLTLNHETARPFLAPDKRGKGGASSKGRDRKELLGTLFWMRLGYEGCLKADLVRRFVDLTGFSDERAIERIVGAVPQEKRDLMLHIGRSRAANAPDPVPCPLPNPTDAFIKSVLAWFDE